ncbi:hypothetical protein ABIC02_007654 [Bradyrhizobium sp. RT5a]
MRRVIGIDVHRTFGEVVVWESGRFRHAGRIDMTRTALEGFGKTLLACDEVVLEATGNSMAVSRVLAPFVARVIIANPLLVKAIAQAHVTTDKIDAGTLASLQAAGYLLQIWTPDAETERKRRLVARGTKSCGIAREERGAFDPARTLGPEVPTCGSFQRPRPGMVGRSTVAGR